MLSCFVGESSHFIKNFSLTETRNIEVNLFSYSHEEANATLPWTDQGMGSHQNAFQHVFLKTDRPGRSLEADLWVGCRVAPSNILQHRVYLPFKTLLSWFLNSSETDSFKCNQAALFISMLSCSVWGKGRNQRVGE